MKGFGIYVKNNLLEPKHIEAMGASVWMYMWLLDKMTSVNENGIGKTLGGQPITFDMVEAELGISVRTYRRWVDQLRDAGYVQTLRTPYGLVITVNKAEKPFKKRSAKSGASKKLNDVPEVTHPDNRDVPDLSSEVPQTVPRSATNGTSNKTIQDNTIDNTSTTNVVEPLAPVTYGKPEINELFEYWAQECGFNIETRVQNNRRAASNLLKKHGREKLMSMIRGVAMAQSDRYAPNIGDFTELQQKLPNLLVWGKKKMNTTMEDQAAGAWRPRSKR